MLLAVDIGNSYTKFGCFEDATLTHKFSIPTRRDATGDEIKAAVRDRLRGDTINRSIVCSVVFDVEHSIRSALKEITGAAPAFVDNSFDFGFKITYEPPESLGTDRLVNAFAAVEQRGVPCIVCSLGTATTIDAVSADREFLGGVIAPGMDAMSQALHIKASRLPIVELKRPDAMLGNSTDTSIRSGIYFGYVAMVEGLINRIKGETGDATVVATGGSAKIVAEECESIDVVEPDLLMQGLSAIATR